MALIEATADVERARLVAFATVFGLCAIAERVAPRRKRVAATGRRWWTNGALMVLGAALVRALAPLGAVGAALWAESNGWGVLHLVESPGWLQVAVSMVVFDLAVWLQHVASHRVPLLWRLHRVHHEDLDLDASSGVRFHPLELLVSIAWKCVVVAALGAPVAAVVASEIVLNACSIFTHANVALPRAIDRALRWVVITPDVHRIHHSREHDEANSNFGFALAVWDRLFGTWRERPRGAMESLALGVAGRTEERSATSLWAQLRGPLE